MNLSHLVRLKVDHSLWDKVECRLRSRLYGSIHINLDNLLGISFADKLFADFNEQKILLPHEAGNSRLTGRRGIL